VGRQERRSVTAPLLPSFTDPGLSAAGLLQAPSGAEYTCRVACRRVACSQRCARERNTTDEESSEHRIAECVPFELHASLLNEN